MKLPVYPPVEVDLGQCASVVNVIHSSFPGTSQPAVLESVAKLFKGLREKGVALSGKNAFLQKKTPSSGCLTIEIPGTDRVTVAVGFRVCRGAISVTRVSFPELDRDPEAGKIIRRLQHERALYYRLFRKDV